MTGVSLSHSKGLVSPTVKTIDLEKTPRVQGRVRWRWEGRPGAFGYTTVQKTKPRTVRRETGASGRGGGGGERGTGSEVTKEGRRRGQGSLARVNFTRWTFRSVLVEEEQ